MNSIIQKQVAYLRSYKFKKHSSGNYAMYGLNFLGGDGPVIQMNGTIWKFLWWEPGTERATFVNAEAKLYTFEPRAIYYSNNTNLITRMEEYEEDILENINIEI